MYTMICTRPYISYTISMTNRYQANPGISHWTVIKNILNYLKRTTDIFLVYSSKQELSVKRYVGTSFQIVRDNFVSQSRYKQ